jgi:hypothetical protein
MEQTRPSPTPGSSVFRFVLKELRELLPPTLFFAIGFNFIELTTQLVLDDYNARFANFMVATVAALVVGKAVLVAHLLPFLHRFDTAPLIRPILFKTAVYTLVVFLVRVLERLLEYAAAGGSIGGLPGYVTTHFTWHRLVAVQLWIMVLFLMYTSVSELDARLGHGELVKMLFAWRASPSRPAEEAR